MVLYVLYLENFGKKEKEGIKMLVLTRQKGQSIIIADQINITVLEVQGKQVRLAIQAPREVSIYRAEICQETETKAQGDPKRITNLVLTRRQGESIIITGNIKITVQAVWGKQVRLAIQAPKETPILRKEILEWLMKSSSEVSPAK